MADAISSTGFFYFVGFDQGDVSLPVGAPIFALDIASIASLGGADFVVIAFFSLAVNFPPPPPAGHPAVVNEVAPSSTKKKPIRRRDGRGLLFSIIFMSVP